MTWVRKYTASKLSDIVGQDVSKVKSFVLNYSKSKYKGLILYGPVGCGKTSTVHAVASDLNLEMVEVNASDARNEEAINSLVGAGLKQRSLFYSGKVILLDEIDGLSGTNDRGGITAVTELLENSKFPIIMTANSPYDSKFSTLRKKCEMVEFKEMSYLDVFLILKKICDAEKISYDEDNLKTLARRSGGDVRGAITDLEVMCTGGKLDSTFDELGGRRQIENMMQAMMRVFKAFDLNIALTSFENVDEDISSIFLWMDENIPIEYTKPGDLVRAYNMLSKADVFYGRIRRWQYWRYLVYCSSLITAGVASAKDSKYGFVQYKPTSRILKMWMAKQKNFKRTAIATKIAAKTHSSVSDVVKNFVFYKKMMNPSMASEFELNEEEMEWMGV